MTTIEPAVLVLDGTPPPTGRVSIEASAGTGKTYSLTQLVVLHVIHHGLSPDQILLVTFTRAATAELRHKTRDMCQRALHALVGRDSSDLPWLAAVIDNDVLRADGIERLSRFLSRYDEANISTIHGFCQRALRRGGLSNGATDGYTVVENISDVVDRVVTDTLAPLLAENPGRLSGNDGSAKEVAATVKEIRTAVHRIFSNQGALLLPSAEGPGLAADISDIVQSIVDAVRTWCRENHIMTHDDLVRLAAESLSSRDENGNYTQTSAQLARELASQLRLIMVDEFQDTDALQWQIFESLHHHGTLAGSSHTLVTVGDAKQAIYRFRGADVGVYIQAEEEVESRFRLSTNRRSNEHLLAGLEHLFTDASGKGFPFDAEGIVRFVPVLHDDNKTRQFEVASEDPMTLRITDAPVEIRWVPRDTRLNGNKPRLKNGKQAQNTSSLVNDAFRIDLADCIVELLRHGRLPVDADTTESLPTRAVRPADIAVLVNSHNQADDVVAALREVLVPAVQLKTGSVLATEAALHFRMFLEGVAHPHRMRKVKGYALSLFGTMDAESLLAATDDDLALLQTQCSHDADLVRERGITALYMHHRHNDVFLARVFSRPDGERMLTDLDHVAEVLAAHPTLAKRSSAPEALAVLEDLIESDSDNEERKRRIETDDSSVTVMTMHASKGLQFPIVVLPTLHASKPRPNDTPLMFTHDLNDGPTRIIDIASGFAAAREWEHFTNGEIDQRIGTFDQRKKIDADEAVRERARLMYVALTRAEHKVIAYWSEIQGNSDVQWAQLIGWSLEKRLTKLPDDAAKLAAVFSEVAASSNGSIATVHLDPDRSRPGEWDGHVDQASDKDVQGPPIGHATFTGRQPSTISQPGSRRWSYSGLTRILKGSDGTIASGAASATGPGPVHGADEYDIDDPTAGDMDSVIEAQPSVANSSAPLLDVAGGTALGTLIHEVFDEIDPSSPDTDSLISRLVQQKLALWPRGADRGVTASTITAGIISTLDCSLGNAYGGTTLRALGTSHRLSELRFDHLLGQDSAFTINDIGALLAKESGIDPVIRAFADFMCADDWSTQKIAGQMTGSIDAVLRADVDGSTRFFVADYKTDRVHDGDDANSLDAYLSPNLSRAMTKRGYMVQALVYSVALHRFLRWRLGDHYDVDRHFGGVTYLFLRGMNGDIDADGNARGVWHWTPSRHLLESLDGLFSRVYRGDPK